MADKRTNEELIQELGALKECNAELRESRRSLETLFTNLPGMVYRCKFGVDRTVEFVSEGSYGLTGYRSEELLGNYDLNCAKLIDPKDREYHEGEIAKSVEQKSSFQLIYRMDSKEGRKKWVWEHGCGIFDDKGELLALEGFITDITERKQAEDKLMLYREIVTHSNDAIVITSPEGLYLEQNAANKTLIGFSDEELEGKTPAIVVGEEPFSALKAKLEEDGIFTGEMFVSAKDGTKVDIDVSAFTVNDETGKIANLVGIVRDITGRKRREEEQIKVERLESIAMLAGGIAHDFNNILTVIMGNIGMSILLVEDGSQVSRKLQSAEKACDKAKAITQQLLTFSTGCEPVKEVLLLADLIRESANMVLTGSNVSCTYSVANDLLPVEADPGQMNQVINNLIINATDAMPEGGSIYVDAENLELGDDSDLPLTKGNYVKVSIRDDGKGIANEYLSKVFDPYFTTKDDGTGIGLATVYSIVKKHDGHLFLQSEVGVGTMIHFYLPALNKQVVSESAQKTERNYTGKGRVLVMDDDQIIRDVVCEVLNSAGFNCDWAEDGKAAVDLYKDAFIDGTPYDLVIMDLAVPGGMGGKDAMAELLKIDSDVKAVVSSGYSNDPVMADHRKFGFKAKLPKPYAVSELQGMVLDLVK